MVKKKENKVKKLNFRVTESEYIKLQEDAKKNNMPMSNYIRQVLFFELQRANSRTKFDKEYQEKILKELMRQGSNVNQMTKSINAVKSEKYKIFKIDRLLEELEAIIKELVVVKVAIIKLINLISGEEDS